MKSKKLRDTDIIFLHSDGRATIRQGYSHLDLRDGILLHILYFGRAIIPINFLLANPEFQYLYTYKDTISEKSDFYRLIKSGDIVPLMFDDDFLLSQPKGSIREYAEFSLDRGILLPCTPDNWLGHAELLNEFKYAKIQGLRTRYRDTFLSFLKDKKIQDHYFPSLSKKYLRFINNIYKKTLELEHPTRSDTYKASSIVPRRKIREGIRLIADAAYYAAFADSADVNPAVPRASHYALLTHYWPTGSPILFEQDDETFKVLGYPIPDFSHIPLFTIIDDLRDVPSRKKWLKTLSNQIKNKETIDPLSDELHTSFGQFTRVIVEYLKASGLNQRKAILKEERRFFIQNRLTRISADVLSICGVGISSLGFLQGLSQGSPSITNLVSLFLIPGTRLLISKAQKRTEAHRPTYGSIIPMARTFTPRGERFG